MAPKPIEIDLDKLRAAIRNLGNEYIFYMLADAIELLPPTKLHKLASKYLDLTRLRPDSERPPKRSLLATVEAFETASLAREYYESFDVNWKNSTEKSKGTAGWIAECLRLLDRCMAQEKKGDPSVVCKAFDIIFGLLDHIDKCFDDIIFFADEAGAWQVGVDWDKILPSWFRVLSATATPDEYARKITSLLNHHHYGDGRDKMLLVAGQIATQAQRKALDDTTEGRT